MKEGSQVVEVLELSVEYLVAVARRLRCLLAARPKFDHLFALGQMHLFALPA